MSLQDILLASGIGVSILKQVDYRREVPGGFYLLDVPVGESEEVWNKLRDLAPSTGHWPVVGWNRFGHLPEGQDTSGTPWTVINEGVQFDAKQWFASDKTSFSRRDFSQTSYDAHPGTGFQLHLHRRQFRGTSAGYVPITLVPTDIPWQVPAYLDISGNDPPASVHVAVMKYWHVEWGAELFGAVPGEIEMLIKRPPSTVNEALGLAREQYVYCPDLVQQNTRTIEGLASHLLNSKVWWFWWD